MLVFMSFSLDILLPRSDRVSYRERALLRTVASRLAHPFGERSGLDNFRIQRCQRDLF